MVTFKQCVPGLQDLAKEAVPHFKPARRFYDGLASQLATQEHALDVFASSLDQVFALLQQAISIAEPPAGLCLSSLPAVPQQVLSGLVLSLSSYACGSRQ